MSRGVSIRPGELGLGFQWLHETSAEPGGSGTTIAATTPS
jgi:hypothetical protein